VDAVGKSFSAIPWLGAIYRKGGEWQCVYDKDWGGQYHAVTPVTHQELAGVWLRLSTDEKCFDVDVARSVSGHRQCGLPLSPTTAVA